MLVVGKQVRHIYQEADLRRMYRKADLNADGLIDLNEFLWLNWKQEAGTGASLWEDDASASPAQQSAAAQGRFAGRQLARFDMSGDRLSGSDDAEETDDGAFSEYGSGYSYSVANSHGSDEYSASRSLSGPSDASYGSRYEDESLPSTHRSDEYYGSLPLSADGSLPLSGDSASSPRWEGVV